MKKTIPQHETISFEQAQIAKFLKKLKFKARLFGVDQADVWKKIEQLNALYETALLAERDRYDRMLQALCTESPQPEETLWDSGKGGIRDETGNF